MYNTCKPGMDSVLSDLIQDDNIFQASRVIAVLLSAGSISLFDFILFVLFRKRLWLKQSLSLTKR